MKKPTLKYVTRTVTFVSLAALMMGNKGCPEEVPAEGRQLRRRVQMGSVTSFAPTIKLPANAGGTTFNFDYAVNAQLQRVLRDTKTFSTVGVFYDPSSVSEKDKAEFYKCSASNRTRAFELSDDAACMVEMPQAQINAAITNFQFTSGGVADIGLLDAVLKGISFNYDKAKLSMEFMANDPLIRDSSGEDRGQTLAAVDSKAYFKDVGGKVTFGLGAFTIGLGGYMASDMGNVVEQALSSGLTDLRKNWDTSADSSRGLSGGWYAMVMKNCDNGIMINAGDGNDAGLKSDDIVAIYNTYYKWSGAVCNSQLQGSMVTTKEPVAYARITVVGNTISLAEIIQNDPAYPVNMDIKIKPGARVYMKKWAPEPVPTVTKSSAIAKK
jgi:hypothetical protein